MGKGLIWVGDARKVIRTFPKPVCVEIGSTLTFIQAGETPENTAPLRGLGKGVHGVYEIRVSHDKEAYRVMYVAKIERGIYVLCAFHKKSKEGKEIPAKDKELILKRYKDALND